MADELARLLSLSQEEYLDSLTTHLDTLLDDTPSPDPSSLYQYFLSLDQQESNLSLVFRRLKFSAG